MLLKRNLRTLVFLISMMPACTWAYYIGDYVWLDSNRDGIQDAGEPGIEGVVVEVRDAQDILLNSVATDPSGYYRLWVSGPGEYLVSVNAATVPSGYIETIVGASNGNQPELDSNHHGGTLVTLTTSYKHDLNIDFGYQLPKPCKGKIGDYIWIDEDRDGLQDVGEPGLNGVKIQLLDPQGSLLMEVTSQADTSGRDGYYLFTGLCAGDYLVLPDLDTIPVGYIPTTNSVGSDISIDSDDHLGVSVSLPDNDSANYTIDFGFVTVCKGQIGDFVWLDADRDGVQDADETGINGVEVVLSDYQGAELMTTTTQTDRSGRAGAYLFTGLCAGDYLVHVNEHSLPQGYEPTLIGIGDPTQDSDDPLGTTVTLSTDDIVDTTIDFGYQTPCAGSIGNYVWMDDDQDGIQDTSESGLSGIKVILRNTQGLVEETVTDQSGYYQFTGLCAGDYVINVDQESVPLGYMATISKAGNDATVDSDDPYRTEVSLPYDSSIDETIDFGYILECHDCAGGVIQLTLRYKGVLSDAMVQIYEGKSDKADKELFKGPIGPGTEFSFYGLKSNGTMGSEISVWINGKLHTKIHTSCSKPIGPGLVSGDFEVIQGYSLQGGLLCPIDTDPGDGCGCEGKVSSLTLQYNGASEAVIKVEQKKEGTVYTGSVKPGESFSFTGIDKHGTLGTEISIYVNGKLDTQIHTSCSKPIGPGLVSGSFKVLEGRSLKGGALCPVETTPEDCKCEGKVTSLTLQYKGAHGVPIRVEQKKEGTVFNGYVSAGGSFSFSGMDKNGTLGTEITIYINGKENTRIHTSCSQPIGIGMVSGAFEILEGSSLKGGSLCLYQDVCDDDDDKVKKSKDDDDDDDKGKKSKDDDEKAKKLKGKTTPWWLRWWK